MDEVVDIVVSESRARAEDYVRKHERQQDTETSGKRVVQFDDEVDVVAAAGDGGAEETAGYE